MIFNIIALIVGVMIFGSGIYYLIKEKDDRESKKIYSIITAAGAVIVVGIIIKMIVM